jgi:hypothetical protein
MSSGRPKKRKLSIITNNYSLFGKGLQQFKNLKKENPKLQAEYIYIHNNNKYIIIKTEC